MKIQASYKQKGFSMIEALIAFVIVVSGLLAVASFQVGLFSSSLYSKARGEAVSLAQEKLEEFKHFTHADETNYIDDNNDGVMDVNGTYQDPAINGQNAEFTRSWELSSSNDGRRVEVSVAWTDKEGQINSVALASTVPWLSPRAGVDQLTEILDPLVSSPTGRAKLGDGNLADYSPSDYSVVTSSGVDGMSTYQLDTDLLLVDGNDNIVLTLEDVCSTSTGVCTDFAKISGTVYIDQENSNIDAEDILVLSSDAAYCQRWVPSGSLSNPPETTNQNYAYYNYTCYLGGGWHGNIGFVTAGGLSLTDKICQGDPTSINAWERPVIALRRAYRGMLYNTVGGQTRNYSHGIKDAAVITGQDYVFTSMSASTTNGSACTGAGAPMSLPDSQGGAIFADVPVDFYCLNVDLDGDGSPDLLDNFDSSVYNVTTTCPFDPTDPPVSNHTISGTINITAAGILDVSSFRAVTSDGVGNCTVSVSAGGPGYSGNYSCQVFDWGTGWNGYVQVDPGSKHVYCTVDYANFSNVTSDQSHNFSCVGTDTVEISGTIDLTVGSASVSGMSITEVLTGIAGSCKFIATAYRCVLPYVGSNVDVDLNVSSNLHVCYARSGVFSYVGANVNDSPYVENIVIARRASSCP